MTVTANPSLAQEYFAQAEALFHAARYREALPLYRKAAEFDPDLWKAVLYFGDCAFQCNQFFIALEFFRETLLARPWEYEVLRFAGDCHLKLGRPEIALDLYELARTQAPSHPPLMDAIQNARRAHASMEGYFGGRVAAADTWAQLLGYVRFRNFFTDLSATEEQFWPRILAFYREYLHPAHLRDLEAERDQVASEVQPESGPSDADDERRALGLAQWRQLDRLIQMIRNLTAAGRTSGPPQLYRFGAADERVTIAQLRHLLGKRRPLVGSASGATDEMGQLRVEGIDWLSSIVGGLPADFPAARAAGPLAGAIWQAVTQQDYDLALARAFGEHELMMSFVQPGLAKSETYPAGEGESEGDTNFDISAAMRAIEDAPDAEHARRAVERAGWHAEAILSFMTTAGPTMDVLFAADYKHAYDLARKLVAISDLIPEKFKRFPLRSFYRLQFLTALQEAAAKLGLHEETIAVGKQVLDVVEAMGPFWNLDLPKLPGTMLRLQTAELPEVHAARACDLAAQSYRQLGDEANAQACWKRKKQVVVQFRAPSDVFEAGDARDLTDELHQAHEPDGALKYAQLALALDPRKYRDASVQFSVNRVLGRIADDLGLGRMRVLYALRALAAAVEMAIPFNILYCLHEIAAALEGRADERGAESFYRRALAQIDNVGMVRKVSMVTTRTGIATLLRLALLVKSRDPDEAERLLLRAINIIEQQRQAIERDLNAAGFGQAGSEIYATLIDLFLQTPGGWKRAFETLERSKIRALLDQFAKQNRAEQDARPPATLAEVQTALGAS
jgi:tetratricopeptide (TPR) repeat protein